MKTMKWMLSAALVLALGSGVVSCEVDDEEKDGSSSGDDVLIEGDAKLVDEVSEGCQDYLDCCTELNVSSGGVSESVARDTCADGIVNTDETVGGLSNDPDKCAAAAEQLGCN